MTQLKETEMGLIPEAWEIKSISEIIAEPLKNGLTKPSRIRGNGYKMVNMKEIFKYDIITNQDMELVPLTPVELNSYLLKQGDILFARQSLVAEGVGKNAIFLGDEPITFESHLIRARVNQNKMNSKYLFYFLRSTFGKNEISRYAEQMAASGIRGSDLLKVHIISPPLEEQAQIAKILSDIDFKIEINKEMNKTLDKVGHTLFKQWFVNFEFPNEEGKPYKSSGGEMTESELGMIPKGWSISTIGKELNTILGGTPSKSNPEFWNGGVPWINSGAINNFPIVTPSEYITEAGLKKSAAKIIPRYSVVLPFVISLGSNISISFTGIETAGNQSVLAIVPDKRFSCAYVYYWVQFMKENIYSWATGGAQQHINKKNVDTTCFLVPEKTVLEHFNSTATPIFEKIVANAEQNKQLLSMRDSLLPKLMSGQIRVSHE